MQKTVADLQCALLFTVPCEAQAAPVDDKELYQRLCSRVVFQLDGPRAAQLRGLVNIPTIIFDTWYNTGIDSFF